MNRIYIPTSSAEDWRKFLAEPEKQWRTGYSAKELAEAWQNANGFPDEVQQVFSASAHPALSELEMLMGIPEYQVNVPGGARPSQNDLFVLAHAKDNQLVSIMVEGKVAEPFGETLETWLANASAGKQERLRFLCNTLGLPHMPPPNLRYQLFHRAASSLIEARRFNAGYAILLIHSFSAEHKWFEDYQNFLGLFGISGKVNALVELPGAWSIQLFTAWVHTPARIQ